MKQNRTKYLTRTKLWTLL